MYQTPPPLPTPKKINYLQEYKSVIHKTEISPGWSKVQYVKSCTVSRQNVSEADLPSSADFWLGTYCKASLQMFRAFPWGKRPMPPSCMKMILDLLCQVEQGKEVGRGGRRRSILGIWQVRSKVDKTTTHSIPWAAKINSPPTIKTVSAAQHSSNSNIQKPLCKEEGVEGEGGEGEREREREREREG